MTEQTFGPPIERTATLTFVVSDLELLEICLEDQIVAYIRKGRFDLAERYVAILNRIEDRLAPCGALTTMESFAHVRPDEQGD